MMKLLSSIISYVLILTMLSSCESMSIDKMTFLGDSIIAKWDVAEEFPGWITENFGKSGCSASYLDIFAGKMQGKEITILVGTNDMPGLTETGKDTYAQEYINSILSLQASHIYLFSILPRETDASDILTNNKIKDVNAAIRGLIKPYPTITYVDVYDDFITGSHVIDALYEPDGLHINNAGYAILQKKLISAIQQ